MGAAMLSSQQEARMPFDFYLAMGTVTLIVVGFGLLRRAIKKERERPFRDDANYDATHDARRAWWD